MHTSTSLLPLISGLLFSPTSAKDSAIPTRALFSTFNDAPQQAFLPALLPSQSTDEPWLAIEELGERNVTLWERLERKIEEARAQARASPCSTSSVISLTHTTADASIPPQSSSPFPPSSSPVPPSSSSSPSPSSLPPPSPTTPLLQKRQTLTTTISTTTSVSLPNGGCPTTYSACTDGNLGWCCPRTAACSRDYLGNVGCCNYGAVCTGTIGAQSTQTQTGSSAVTTVTTAGGGAAGATTTGGAGFIMVSGTNVATLGVGGGTSGAGAVRDGVGYGLGWGLVLTVVVSVGTVCAV